MMHKLIVTKVADESDDDTTYELQGPHDRSCAVWYECPREGHPEPEDVDYEPTEVHGVEHAWIDSSWMVAGKDCGGLYDDELWMLAESKGIGEHDVQVEYEGDGCWVVS